MRARLTAEPGKVERYLASPSCEGVATMFTALTGRTPTAEEIDRMRARFAAAERRAGRNARSEPFWRVLSERYPEGYPGAEAGRISAAKTIAIF